MARGQPEIFEPDRPRGAVPGGPAAGGCEGSPPGRRMGPCGVGKSTLLHDLRAMRAAGDWAPGRNFAQLVVGLRQGPPKKWSDFAGVCVGRGAGSDGGRPWSFTHPSSCAWSTWEPVLRRVVSGATTAAPTASSTAASRAATTVARRRREVTHHRRSGPVVSGGRALTSPLCRPFLVLGVGGVCGWWVVAGGCSGNRGRCAG